MEEANSKIAFISDAKRLLKAKKHFTGGVKPMKTTFISTAMTGKLVKTIPICMINSEAGG